MSRRAIDGKLRLHAADRQPRCADAWARNAMFSGVCASNIERLGMVGGFPYGVGASAWLALVQLTLVNPRRVRYP